MSERFFFRAQIRVFFFLKAHAYFPRRQNVVNHCDKPCQRVDLFMSALELEDIYGGWRPLMLKDYERINMGTCSGYCQFSLHR